jgi:hypothetical protein
VYSKRYNGLLKPRGRTSPATDKWPIGVITARRLRHFSFAAPLSSWLRRVVGSRRVGRRLRGVSPLLPPILSAIALVNADGSLLLAAVLPSVPPIAAPVRSLGLYEAEQLITRYVVHPLATACAHWYGHAAAHAEHD